MAGYTDSFGAGKSDLWLLKLDAGGNITRQKSYGGTGRDAAYSIQETSDGYIAAGDTESFGAGDYDFWVLKLGSGGNVIWQKTYGGDDFDRAHSIEQISDGGYIMAGETESFGTGRGNVWVLKLDESGIIPECPLIENSAATITDTTITGSDMTISGVDTTAIPADTSVMPSDTDCSIETQCPTPPVGAPVGGEVYPINKLAVLAPWIGLATLLISGISWLVLKRRRA